MSCSGLCKFISSLEKRDDIIRISTFVNPVLEISEVADRMIKNDGKALLFENTGTAFPVLINAYGSDKRMALAMGRDELGDAAAEITSLLTGLAGNKEGLLNMLSSLPALLKVARFFPKRSKRKARCHQVVHRDPDLSMLPVLKCWPHDGGRYVTLPVVHTLNPLTLKPNAGMYRMQVIDSKTTAMHWQLHKTGANHFAEWKKLGRKMPVSVTLGGDPVYAYAASAPLPEDVDEFILSGFLRGRRVSLVKCLTNDLYVPADADIVIEGYIDPAEEPFYEGPFGDHTGFYSLTDYYPKFHLTCITHARKAVYPATIVGIPPMEDAWIAKATEKLFLAPLKLALLPEIEDIHMPTAGVAHNLVVVKTRKSYPGQGKKVIGSLLGAGQMMFTKYIVVVSGDVDIRNYRQLIAHIRLNTDTVNDLQFTTGPLDVLDHASDVYTLGGKLGIDATEKMPGEIIAGTGRRERTFGMEVQLKNDFPDMPECIRRVSTSEKLGIVVLAVDQLSDRMAVRKAEDYCSEKSLMFQSSVVLVVDSGVDVDDLYTVTWQVLGNSDPGRDIRLLEEQVLFVDGTAKVLGDRHFPRRWPNAVCSDIKTIDAVDGKWGSLGLGDLIVSPSLTRQNLLLPGNEEVRIEKHPG
ncbi:MAG: menaquinone biosynthesis decarboxylase [Bacteroidales bacterium]|nr:menaquinone biosynthesis decarboxylase [Bacteroidales bacterium]MBN2632696.1 menaquinone biosynthesis decarboxylase [Bacteroidales bacterium]